jgi:hypothetical protein
LELIIKDSRREILHTHCKNRRCGGRRGIDYHAAAVDRQLALEANRSLPVSVACELDDGNACGLL